MYVLKIYDLILSLTFNQSFDLAGVFVEITARINVIADRIINMNVVLLNPSEIS